MWQVIQIMKDACRNNIKVDEYKLDSCFKTSLQSIKKMFVLFSTSTSKISTSNLISKVNYINLILIIQIQVRNIVTYLYATQYVCFEKHFLGTSLTKTRDIYLLIEA